MKNNPLVTVVIPIYNNSKYIGTCIESVLQQTYTNIECIVVDDGSTDDTASIVKEHEQQDKRLSYYYKKNGGSASAINYGIERSRGEWLHVLDSDDYINHSKIEKQLAAGIKAKTENNYVLVYSDYKVFYDEDGGMSGKDFEIIIGELTKEEILNRIVGRKFGLNTPTPITMNSMLVSKNIFKEHMYNDSMRNTEDLEFYYRMLQSDVTCIYVPMISMYYRQHLGGDSKNMRTALVGYTKFLETIYETNKNDLAKFPNLKALIDRAIKFRDEKTLQRLRSLLLKSRIPVYTGIFKKEVNVRILYVTLERIKLLPLSIKAKNKLNANFRKIAKPGFVRKLFNKVAFRLGVAIQSMEKRIARATLPKFANKPANLRIDLPRRIDNPEYIRIGDNVSIGPGSLLKAVVQYPGSSKTALNMGMEVQRFTPKLRIGNRVSATASLQISVLDEIIIEDDVMFASNIWLCDGFHGYENTDVPYKYQPMFNIAPINIGRGCWIGQNVVVMPGVTIGAMCIIGANSVVTKSIPEKSIAIGSPARVIKRWNDESNRWQSVKEDTEVFT